MSPQVSVIVPNYNHAQYLVQRIESVLAQTCQDFELILLDDCSPDNSREVLERYRTHPRVAHIVYNEANSGSTFKQWDKGIALARGEYIWIAESDDWCEPTLLETLLDGIHRDQDCVLSYCQTYFINPQDGINWQSQHRALSEVVDGPDFIRQYLVSTSIYNASMALWKKDCYPRVSRDFTQYRFCGDWLFWIGLARLGKVHISGKLLNYYRQHSNNVSTGVYKSGLSFVEELRVLNIMYTDRLIGDREYSAAFKKKYREYWPVREQLDPALNQQIHALFQHPLSPKTNLLAIKAGALWKQIRPGKSR
ncbi:glycosyltransferase family 2 protein [Lysobacter sp. CFH 32150]|uniref:glycosyltransferase family 2 protein n=1 Tax=Lysobacter sp. CFH 32150 TaxID=2927128 RepID=UPI001FA7687D|nr:glycosyltransferase family 2 protein [Lysobacter sp. CFH 32150]MCI4568533.1 glycosyltransferase [Lysobacter sp. CFH 32150]